MSASNNHCVSCRFFHMLQTNGTGRCHRYPPSVPSALGEGIARHPRVLPTDWCGEWTKKGKFA